MSRLPHALTGEFKRLEQPVRSDLPVLLGVVVWPSYSAWTGEEGWLAATGHASPAVEEEDSHGQSSGLGSLVAGCLGVWRRLFEEGRSS